MRPRLNRHAVLSSACSLERLEDRRLLSDVSGTVFFDANKNGAQDAGENGLGSVRVYIDENLNGQYDQGEVFDDTDPTGSATEGQWSFEGLDAGEIVVRVMPGDANGVTKPAAAQDNEYVLNLDGTTNVTDIDFGIGNSTIGGRVFRDANGNNTYDAGEALQNILVYIDDNGNGIYDSGETHVFTKPRYLGDGVTPNPDAGRYTFVDLDAGQAYKVRVNPAHYQVRVSDNPADITPTPLQDVTEADVAALVFRVADVSAIGGQVFDDANGNGIRDDGEALLAGVQVYADVNGNGAHDAGEPQNVSVATLNPQNQNYVLRGVTPGNHTVRVGTMPTGYGSSNPESRIVTTIAGEETSNTHFGLAATTATPGNGLNDFNQDGNIDMVVQNGDDVVVWMLGAPGGTSPNINIAAQGSAVTLASPGAGWTVGGYGDFDGDGHPDVLYHNDTSGENVLYTFEGTTKTGEMNLPTLADKAWRTVTAGDFDGDGDLDIMWRHSTTGQNTLWLLGDSPAITFKALPTTALPGWTVAGTGDFDGDGDRDILWYNHTSNRSTTWLIDTTQPKIIPVFRGGPTLGANSQSFRRLAVDDFDKDGISDILFASPSDAAQNVLWYLNHQTEAERIKGFGRVTGIA